MTVVGVNAKFQNWGLEKSSLNSDKKHNFSDETI